ncbi:hypothetical protein [Ruminiclostridium cellobioparum]|uniref:hypothetical protein n=1 Tax=Ruminiclostridium cellobioparum TaxID=29355 RepID=UPI0006862043|nr:hypothetical protein [Ruminiclostridium cellobioparum]
MSKKFTFILVLGSISIILIIICISFLFPSTFTKTTTVSGALSSGGTTETSITDNGTENSRVDGISPRDNKSGPAGATIKNAIISDAEKLIEQTHYKQAGLLLEKSLEEYPNDKELLAVKDRADNLEKQTVIYKGPVYHVFFHSLIVYPELCFTGDSMEQGYNYWMTTVKEFKMMIQEMYDRGYTLVDLRDMFKMDSSGKMQKQDIFLPEGQKPLIISVDDMSYYKYMENDGFAKKLVIDQEGKLASLVKTPQGNEIVSPDGDVVPILNNFVDQNPDFSFKGAKGTLALTGYEGILGYRTNHDNSSWQTEKESVLPVIEKLKETGWAFASHSYTHRRTFSEGTITLDFLKYDTKRWRDEVGSIVGETNLYISPFGATFKQNDARMRYIVSQSFNVYCGVGPTPDYILYKDNAYMERIDLDGYKMFHKPECMKELFDAGKILDPVRPAFK